MNSAFLDRRWWGAGLLACFIAVVAALAMPVDLPRGTEDTDSPSALPVDTAASAPEDLGVFLDSRRWGASLREILEAAAEKARQAEAAGQPKSAVNPALAKMGFIGLIVSGGRSEVLLEAPDGGVARFAPGDTLPDGRTLVTVTDNSLTLKGEDSPEEVLTLFPRVRSGPSIGDDSPPVGGAGSDADAAPRSD